MHCIAPLLASSGVRHFAVEFDLANLRMRSEGFARHCIKVTVPLGFK